MKVLRKTDAVRLRQVEHVNAERFILVVSAIPSL